MKVLENIPLKIHSTMGLGGNARFLTTVTSVEELKEAINWAASGNQRVLPIGKGSNIVWSDEGFNGLVIIMEILGRERLDRNKLRFGAGEVWDAAVAYSVEAGLSGLEPLSMIPGTVGATPVQNVGAYGTEVADSLVELEAYDLQELKMTTIKNADCDFSYRSSRFKTTDKGRFIITSVTFELSDQPMKPPFYESLQNYLDGQGATDYSPATIRQAVIAVRASKLPDPSVAASNGSFFENPIVDAAKFEALKAEFNDIKGWPVSGDRVKLAAGWLVESVGFKGIHDAKTGMAVWPNQALVLVNEHAKKTADLLDFRDRIIDAVAKKFGVTLKQEPEFIGWED